MSAGLDRSNFDGAMLAGQVAGQPLKSKAEALDLPRVTTPDLLPPAGTLDSSSIATETRQGTVREIKEWQAIRDHLRSLPVTKAGHPDIS